ncbi:hypothetical protein GCM10020256_03730 [Streptomyces thermocoprophilus]
MTFSLAIVGAGQFSARFAELFAAHPGVAAVHVADLLPERAERLVAAEGLAGTFPSYEAVLDSPAIDAVALFTQRWTHGPLVLAALRAASTSSPPSRWRSPWRRSPRSSTRSGRAG